MSESVIKRDILEWLNSQPGCFAKVIQVSGVRGRRSPTKGCSDIIGTWQGLAIAVEVKTREGRLEDSQETFITSWTIRGRGISILARSIEDVARVLQSERVRRMAALLGAETWRDTMDFRPGKDAAHATTL